MRIKRLISWFGNTFAKHFKGEIEKYDELRKMSEAYQYLHRKLSNRSGRSMKQNWHTFGTKSAAVNKILELQQAMAEDAAAMAVAVTGGDENNPLAGTMRRNEALLNGGVPRTGPKGETTSLAAAVAAGVMPASRALDLSYRRELMKRRPAAAAAAEQAENVEKKNHKSKYMFLFPYGDDDSLVNGPTASGSASSQFGANGLRPQSFRMLPTSPRRPPVVPDRPPPPQIRRPKKKKQKKKPQSTGGMYTPADLNNAVTEAFSSMALNEAERQR